MSFAFSAGAPVGEECRRVLLAEAEGARSGLARFEEDPDGTVHEARKHNKRMRSVLLMARPVLDSGDIAKANRIVRDAARRFSPARDALVRQETLAKLVGRFGSGRLGRAGGKVRKRLRERHDRILRDVAFPERTEAASRDFAEAARIVENWDWSQVGMEEVLAAVVSNYRHAVAHFERSRESRDPDECHEWRKRAKYLSFHYRLLAFLDPAALGPRAELAEELASWLGEHHDLAVLEETLLDHEGLGLSSGAALALVRLCEERRAELEEAAFERGAIVHAERPEDLSERLGEGVWSLG